MARDSQTGRLTQIQVRVDCNGCVRKIKKALNGINGIHDLRVDLHRQMLTIMGWADPEKVVNAIKKTKKNAIICSDTELASPSQESQPTESKGNAPAIDATQPTEARASPKPAENNASQQGWNAPGTNCVGEVHVIHHHLPNYVNRFGSGHGCEVYNSSPVFLQQPPQPLHVTHSYNTYIPSPYVTEYEYARSPPIYTYYHHMEHYTVDYPTNNVSITSMFSDDNPNACCIV